MTCAACAARIEKVLNRVPGTRAAVNFATQTAVADVDPAVTGLGTTMAWAFSAVVTLTGLHEHVYFEASAAVITLVMLGKLLEARARARASAALEGLLGLQPRTAHVLRDGGMVDLPLDEVA